MKLHRLVRRVAIIVLTLTGLTTVSGCGGDGGGVNVKGVTGSVLSVLDGSAQASRPFIVNDLSQPPESAQVSSGTSDSNGQYTFELKGIKGTIYVVFPPNDATGEPRSSGLVYLGERENEKTLQNFTDVACVAGVTAVLSGDLPVEQLTAERIANLEAAAQQVIAEDGVDFTNADSVNAAAARVRELTNDGANPPP
ncbi:MAG: hypothetical protein WC809_09840 [Sinimarinibacterium sp.]|jgi:hypothetical protein